MMKDINYPSTLIGYQYKIKTHLPDLPLFLCAENSKPFTLTIGDQQYEGKLGFNYWPIDASEVIMVLSDKKIFNLYVSYTDLPRQFY